MKTIKLVCSILIGLCTVHADELAPQEIEKCRDCATQIFEGVVQSVQISPEEDSKIPGERKLAKVKITGVSKGDLAVTRVVNIYYYHMEGRKPKSPSLTEGRKYKFFLHKKPAGEDEIFILSDHWLSVEIEEGDK